MLTTGADTVPGSTATELITAGATALSSTDTLQATDQIDGGAGRDTLNLAITKNFGGFTVGSGFLKNVETVNLNNTSTTGVTFTGKAVTGVEAYNITGPVSVSAMDSVSTRVNVANITTASTTVSVGYEATKVTGSSDAATVGVSNLGVASTSSSDPFGGTLVTVDVDGIESITLSSSGKNYMTLDGDKATSLTYVGDGSLVLRNVPTTVKSYDGSASAGAQVVRFDAATSISSVKTGTGNDVIYAVEADDLRADATVDGGSGTDTLVINNTVAQTAAFSLSGVETVSIAAVLATTGAQAVTFAPTTTTGLSTVSLAANQTGGAHAITLGAIPITLDVNAATAATSTAEVTVSNTGTGTLNFKTSATANTVNLQSVKFSKATTLDVNLAKYVVYGAETEADPTNGAKITASAATKVTVSGEGDFGSTIDGLVLPVATTLTINQQTQDQSWGVGVSKGTATSAKLTTLDLKQAGTVALTGDGFVNLENITVSTGTHFNGSTASGDYTGNFPKITSVTLSGSQTASQVSLGSLGDANAYGLSLTATGLKGGLSVGDIEVGAGQAVSIQLTGKTGSTATALDAIRVGADSTTPPTSLTGSVLLNAAGAAATGNLNVDEEVYAKTVTLDASGSSFSNVTFGVGVITGETVTIKAPSAPTTFSVVSGGSIAVKDSLTLVGPTTKSANGDSTAVVVNAHTGSTALTVDLTGGLAPDTFVITGIATNTSITVKGDLKGDAGGDDKVTINASASTVSGGQTVDVTGLVDSGTSITGASGKDTIKGSAGSDTITAGSNADTIDISQGGNDKIVLRSPVQDTGEVTVITTSAGVQGSALTSWTGQKIESGSYVSTSGLDKITGFGAGDTIVTNSRTSGSTDMAEKTALQTIGSVIGEGRALTSSGSTLSSTGTAAIDVFIPGTYDASNNRFTFNASGADTLYMINGAGNSTLGSADFYGLVLVGYASGAATDTTTGFTGVVGAAFGA